MILPRFDVLVPESVEEACAMLADHADEGVRLLGFQGIENVKQFGRRCRQDHPQRQASQAARFDRR